MARQFRKSSIILGLLFLSGLGWTVVSQSKLTSFKTNLTAKKVAEPSNGKLQLVEKADGQMVIEWDCPPYGVKRDEVSGQITSFSMKGTASIFEPGVPELPGLSQLLDCLPGNVTIQILEEDYETQNLGQMSPMPEDFLVDYRASGGEVEEQAQGSSNPNLLDRKTLAERVAETPRKHGLWPEQTAVITEGGVYRGHRLLSLNIYPIRVNCETGETRILKHIRVRVNLPRETETRQRIPDRRNETEILSRMLGPLAETARRDREPERREWRTDRGGSLDDSATVNTNRWKLIVNETSVVHVTGELLRFYGVPLDQITTWDMKLWNRGQQVPIRFSGEEDGHFDDFDFIDFYGEPLTQTYSDREPSMYQDPYTTNNVYTLTWGDGVPAMRMSQEDGTYHPNWNATERQNVRAKIHFEKDVNQERLQESQGFLTSDLTAGGPLNVYEDHWFWGERIDAQASREFPVNIPFPDPASFVNPVTVRACLHGFNWQVGHPVIDSTDSHHAIVFVNGFTERGLTAGRSSALDPNPSWRGQTPIILVSNPVDTLPPGISNQELLNGINIITVAVPGDGMAQHLDKILVNWFEIEYDRDVRGRLGSLKFTFDEALGDTFFYDIRGFGSSHVEVWKLGQSRLTGLDRRRVTPSDETASWAVRLQLVSWGPQEILVFDDEYLKPPALIVPDSSTVNLREQTGAEYVLVYHDVFSNDPSLLRLDSLRRASFNGSVLTVPVSAVYSQFSHGLETPIAIHDFMKYAYENWVVRPTHLCIVGDGMLEQRDGHPAGNLISSIYAQTFQFGISASDVLFGCVSGPPWDIIPDIAVGRISARTPVDLETYVEKILLYESAPDFQSIFQSRALFVADLTDSQFDFVKDFSEPTIASMEPDFNLSRVYLDSLPPGQGPIRLREALRDGAVVCNYNGHGGGGVWSGEQLINVNGVRLLNNQEMFPFITNYTCYVGAFDSRGQSSVLGEAFLFIRNNNNDLVGAIGFYSSSGVGWALAGRSMQRYLFNFIMEPPGLTLGEATLMNKATFWTAQTNPIDFSNVYSMMMMMNLLGDPGLKLRIPDQEFSPRLDAESNVVTHGQTIRVRGTLPWNAANETEPTFFYILPYNGDQFDCNGPFCELYASHRPAYDLSRIIPLFADSVVAGTNEFITDTISIHDSFLTTRADVVVYATNPFSNRNAIGSFPIFLWDSLSNVQVFELEVQPNGAIFNQQPFLISAEIVHQDEIESVHMRGVFRPAQGPIVLDTLDMLNAPSGRWLSSLLGPYHSLGGSYRVKFYATTVNGELFETPYFDLPTERQIDVSLTGIVGATAGIRAGSRPVFYQPVHFTRLTDAIPYDTLVVRMTAVSDSFTSQGEPVVVDSFVSEVRVAPLTNQITQFETFIPADFQLRPYRISIALDPDSMISERDENNNTAQYQIGLANMFRATRIFGTYYPRPFQIVPHRFYGDRSQDTLSLFLPPNAITVDSTTLVYSSRLSVNNDIANWIQNGLNSPLSQSFPLIFHAMVADSSEYLDGQAPAQITILHHGSDTLRNEVADHDLAIFSRRQDTGLWRRLDEQEITIESLDTTVVFPPPQNPRLDTLVNYRLTATATSHDLGELVLLRVVDTQGPSVELAVGGLRFTAFSTIPRRPIMFANLFDLSGVDHADGKFFISIDGDTIPAFEIAWTDSLEFGGSTAATFRPEFESGSHTIAIFATDNLGNSTGYSADFEVRSDFGIDWAINYPNPFKKTTTISYVLSGVTDDFVEVKIYTVSGRLIKTLRDSERATANYRSQVWDGTDAEGRDVANGVYFARIEARQGDQKIEQIVKLAKVRQ